MLLSETGECEQFSYSGCRGNNNRFMSEAACSATCRHAAIRRTTDITCKLFIGPNTAHNIFSDTRPVSADLRRGRLRGARQLHAGQMGIQPVHKEVTPALL